MATPQETLRIPPYLAQMHVEAATLDSRRQAAAVRAKERKRLRNEFLGIADELIENYGADEETLEVLNKGLEEESKNREVTAASKPYFLNDGGKLVMLLIEKSGEHFGAGRFLSSHTSLVTRNLIGTGRRVLFDVSKGHEKERRSWGQDKTHLGIQPEMEDLRKAVEIARFLQARLNEMFPQAVSSSVSPAQV